MSRVIDYSKWKNIDVSDDEDDTHPNIDTPSLFKWRHEARVQKEEEFKKKKEELAAKKSKHLKEKAVINEMKGKEEEVAKLKSEWDKKDAEIKAKEEEIQKEERLMPWNVDTISQSGFTKTVINTKPKADPKALTDEEKAEKLQQFSKANEGLMKQFGLLRKYQDSRKFLLEHPHLACEETTSYLTIWCVNLALEEKTELMEHVSHQCIAMQFMLELAKQLDRDPRAVISDFFSKIAHAEQLEYKQAFEEELSGFRIRILRRADEKIAEAEEEERQQRLGPGGLDPFEVFETLPGELKKCFESQDIPMLQEAISKLPPDEATYHMKRCVESGLWVPGESTKTSKEDGLLQDEVPEEDKADKDGGADVKKSDMAATGEDEKPKETPNDPEK